MTPDFGSSFTILAYVSYSVWQRELETIQLHWLIIPQDPSPSLTLLKNTEIMITFLVWGIKVVWFQIKMKKMILLTRALSNSIDTLIYKNEWQLGNRYGLNVYITSGCIMYGTQESELSCLTNAIIMNIRMRVNFKKQVLNT